MANTITRKFEVYNVQAVDVTIGEDMQPQIETLCDFNTNSMSMNDMKARAAVRDELGADRLPATVKVMYKLLGEKTYSMSVADFIKGATEIANVETVEDEEN